MKQSETFMKTVRNVGRLGTLEPERINALERIIENVHGSVTFKFSKLNDSL
jgi:hypothetical protein